MRFVRTVVVANNIIRLALNSNPPVAWIRPRKINPLITTAVRTYAKHDWTYARTVATYEDIKKAMKEQDQFIVDLRDPNEVASTGRIPTSINIPASYLDSALVMTDMDFQRVYKRRKPSKQQDLIFYCRNGQLAAIASNKAVKHGFLRVKTYAGSWEDWECQTKLDVKKYIKAGKKKGKKAGKKKIMKTKEPDEP